VPCAVRHDTERAGVSCVGRGRASRPCARSVRRRITRASS